MRVLGVNEINAQVAELMDVGQPIVVAAAAGHASPPVLPENVWDDIDIDEPLEPADLLNYVENGHPFFFNDLGEIDEEEDAAFRRLLRDAEVDSSDEEAEARPNEEEDADFRQLMDAEEELEEESDAEEDRAIGEDAESISGDSGIGSIGSVDSEATTIRNEPDIDLEPPMEEEEMAMEEEEEDLLNADRETLERVEVRLRHLRALKLRYLNSVIKLVRLVKKQAVHAIKRRLNRVNNRRAMMGRENALSRRNRDLPRRRRDMCFGCGKLFYLQRTRRWSRCEACGDWLCPDCNEQPEHCQNEDILNNL